MADDGVDWGGTTKTAPAKTEKKSFGGRSLQNFVDIATSLHKIPIALWKEGMAVGTMFSGEYEPPKELVSKKGDLRTKAIAGLTVPGVRLLPTTYAASQVLKGGPKALLDEPLFSLLDILPGARTLTRGVTRGSTIAAKAGERAATLGKIAKAERIAQRGLEPRQLVGEIARSVEEAMVAKAPRLMPFKPSRLIETAGLGGERLRSFLTTLAVADREMANASRDFVNATMIEAKRLKISRQRAAQISHMAEFEQTPGWQKTLAPNEQEWLTQMQKTSNELTDYWVDQGKLFRHGGEVYSTKQQAKLLENIKRAEHAAKQAEQAEIPVPSKSTRPAGTFRGKTTQDWLKMQQAAEARVTKLTERARPARYVPIIRKEVVDAIERLGRGQINHVDMELAIEHFLNRNYKGASAVLGTDTVRQLSKGAIPTWQELRARGVEPIYMPHINPSDARSQLLRPRLTRVIKQPGFTLGRSMNMEPSVENLAVGVSAQGVEHLRAIYARKLWDDLRAKKFLLTKTEALREIEPMIEADIARAVSKGADPASIRRLIIEKRLGQMYGKFAPASMFPSGPGGLRVRPGEEWFLPKGLHRALTGEHMGILKQADLGTFAKVAGLPMSVFRISILGLNAAYYIGNVVSGAIMTAAHKPTALLGFRMAANKLRTGDIPKELSIGWREGTAEQASSLRRFKTANELTKILDEQDITNSIPPVIRQIKNQAVRVPAWLNNVASSIDDMYKVMTYLSEQKGALKKGLSKEAAKQAGIELAHKVLVDFDRLTPLEKTAIRSVVPFYSWTQHLLRYTMSYPFDHPLRMAVITALSRNIANEWPEGLPERFKKDLFWDDDTRRLPMSNYIPMVGVPDMLPGNDDAFRGLFSRLNPLLQSLMEFSGSDPYSFAPPVFGARQTRYDPVAGREVGVRPRLLPKLLELSPQVRQLWSWISDDPEWLRLVEANPEAARAAAWRAFGISIPREVDIQEEIAKAQEAQERVLQKQEREREKAETSSSGGDGVKW